jgi:hypothetical protein
MPNAVIFDGPGVIRTGASRRAGPVSDAKPVTVDLGPVDAASLYRISRRLAVAIKGRGERDWILARASRIADGRPQFQLLGREELLPSVWIVQTTPPSGVVTVSSGVDLVHLHSSPAAGRRGQVRLA